MKVLLLFFRLKKAEDICRKLAFNKNLNPKWLPRVPLMNLTLPIKDFKYRRVVLHNIFTYIHIVTKANIQCYSKVELNLTVKI